MKVQITKAIRDEAGEMNETVLQNIKSTPNYTGLAEPDRFLYGFIGELLFRDALKAQNIRYVYDVCLNGESQGNDFTGYVRGVERKIDVKTASQPTYKYILQPKAQYDLYDYHYYVGVRLNGDTASICGFCYKKDFIVGNEYQNFKIPTMYNFLKDLHSIKKLFEILDKNQSTLF